MHRAAAAAGGRLGRRGILSGLGGAAAAFSLSTLGSCARAYPTGPNGEERRLNLYNWDTYTGKSTLADFKAASGVEVKMSLFATNDELFSKLKAGNPGFDVIVPSNDFVSRMIASDMLTPLDHRKIPNRANLLTAFQSADFDPGRRYSMPYTWLVLGIGYRRSRTDGVPDSWKWLLDSDRYRGRIGLFSQADDLIGLGAKYLGRSARNIPTATVEEIARMYVRQKPNVKIFHNDEGQDLLLAGEVDVVMEYNGDIAQVMQEDPDLAFVVPKEGSIINSDCLCIPKGAPRPDNAHQFINFVLGAAAGANISATIMYPTPNAAALALMPSSYRENAAIFPPSDVMARCEYAAYEGLERAQLYDETLTRIFAA